MAAPMFVSDQGRWLIKWDECPIRVDLAPGAMPVDQLRLPTGWLDLGEGKHVCGQCAQRHLRVFRRSS